MAGVGGYYIPYISYFIYIYCTYIHTHIYIYINHQRFTSVSDPNYFPSVHPECSTDYCVIIDFPFDDLQFQLVISSSKKNLPKNPKPATLLGNLPHCLGVPNCQVDLDGTEAVAIAALMGIFRGFPWFDLSPWVDYDFMIMFFMIMFFPWVETIHMILFNQHIRHKFLSPCGADVIK
jgi:hypothetical protein